MVESSQGWVCVWFRHILLCSIEVLYTLYLRHDLQRSKIFFVCLCVFVSACVVDMCGSYESSQPSVEGILL